MGSWEEPFLQEFKFWYTDVDGFGEYLYHFIAHYGRFFREHEETHAFIYTKLHKEFSANLEAAVDAWLASKGMTQEHLAAILEFGRANGDAHLEGIVDAMIRVLEYPSWIEYIFRLKQDPTVMESFERQREKQGWRAIGDTTITWGTHWWEQWTDAEWDQWWADKQRWSEEEWDEWYKRQDTWNGEWQNKAHSWTNKRWTNQSPDGGYTLEALPMASPSSAVLTIKVPEGVDAGCPLQVQTPDGQLLTAIVPEGIAAGGSFNVSYVPVDAARTDQAGY